MAGLGRGLGSLLSESKKGIIIVVNYNFQYLS